MRVKSLARVVISWHIGAQLEEQKYKQRILEFSIGSGGCGGGRDCGRWMRGGHDVARRCGQYGRGRRSVGRSHMMINGVAVLDPTRNLYPMNGPD